MNAAAASGFGACNIYRSAIKNTASAMNSSPPMMFTIRIVIQRPSVPPMKDERTTVIMNETTHCSRNGYIAL